MGQGSKSMNTFKPLGKLASAPTNADFTIAEKRWQKDYARQIANKGKPVNNRSGIAIKPLYYPSLAEAGHESYVEKLGFPGAAPMTRGIYATMHRGRTWSQRQLIGLGTPADYNARIRKILDAGATALSLIPCNSVYRGIDCDACDIELLGTCGTIINTQDDMDTALAGIALDEISIGLNDPLPYTLHALLLAVARSRGISWSTIRGTSNQSDYISHFAANHMFYRLSLEGSKRVQLDTIEFCAAKLPRWNALSVVGQHMQQAGATPAQAMGLTLSTAIQYANDCIERGMDPASFLARFTFFFDISISFFEEIAKFRAGRRIWASLVRERFGVSDPRCQRFKFHAQTSGCDLTRQQPLNNIARVAIQAMAGILGGLQSLHTDAHDEVLSTPTEDAAKIAIATQNILKHEARMCDVIDPLGGSYYLEQLTDEMETIIRETIALIDEAGGMYQAVKSGIVQTLIGNSALEFQQRVETGEQIIVGVNAYVEDEDRSTRRPLERPDPAVIKAHVERTINYKKQRSQESTERGLKDLRTAARSNNENLFAAAIAAVQSGATHGEIIAVLRDELGFGQPLIVA